MNKPNRDVLDALQPGFYVLTDTVRNPKPDRRNKNSIVVSGAEWPAGFRVQVRRFPIHHPDAVTEKGSRNEIRQYGSMDTFVSGSVQEDNPQAEMVAPLLAPAEPALGQLLDSDTFRPEAVLAMLVEMGKITLEDVRSARERLDVLSGDPDDVESDEEVYNDFLRKHWVDILTSQLP